MYTVVLPVIHSNIWIHENITQLSKEKIYYSLLGWGKLYNFLWQLVNNNHITRDSDDKLPNLASSKKTHVNLLEAPNNSTTL